jgi:hypothetical protein
MTIEEYIKILDIARKKHLEATTMNKKATVFPDSHRPTEDLGYWIAVTTKELNETNSIRTTP